MRRLIGALEGFAAVSALAGASALLGHPSGHPLIAPIELLRFTPFQTFLVPGLLLGLIGALNLAALIFGRRRFGLDLASFAGGGLTVWIVAEAALMRTIHWLHLVYGGIGLAILALGMISAWRSGAPRYRWLITVTWAETLGFVAPVLAGVLAVRLGLGDLAELCLLGAAGFVEGFVLGAGQGRSFPWPVRRLRYALLSGAGAALVWAAMMALVALGGGPTPVALVVALGVIAAILGAFSIGLAQWLELRRSSPLARRWIPWTALAWVVALPLSFAPSPLVDETTPLGAQIALWAGAGLLMAYVMATITWQGVRHIRPENSPG